MTQTAKYPNYDDLARLEYGRLFWRSPEMRGRLLAHWTDSRHPYRERFLRKRELIERILQAADEKSLEALIRADGMTVRAISREIPPVFGSFWGASRGGTDP